MEGKHQRGWKPQRDSPPQIFSWTLNCAWERLHVSRGKQQLKGWRKWRAPQSTGETQFGVWVMSHHRHLGNTFYKLTLTKCKIKPINARISVRNVTACYNRTRYYLEKKKSPWLIISSLEFYKMLDLKNYGNMIFNKANGNRSYRTQMLQAADQNLKAGITNISKDFKENVVRCVMANLSREVGTIY